MSMEKEEYPEGRGAGTVSFKKAVSTILEQLPKEAKYKQVQGAICIGLLVKSSPDGQVYPEIDMWANLPTQAVLLTLEDLLARMRAKIAAESKELIKNAH